jgi:hypothetical protein
MKKTILWIALVLARGCAPQLAAAQNSQPQTSYAAQLLSANPGLYLTFNNPASPLRENQTGVNFIASSSGTLLANQPGFDNTQGNNTAESFTYNAYAYAPNNTLGSFEWNQPFWGVFQIDNLQWVRSGTKVLLTKGATNGNFYQLYITMYSATMANFCVQMYGRGAIVSPSGFSETTCTANAIDMPNGLNYSLAFANDGTGQPNTNGLSLSVNGLPVAGVPSANRFAQGGNNYALGGIVPTISGGTGYAAATPVNGIGGGTNCSVFFSLPAASGVPSAPTMSYKTNYGCTSVPTLTPAPINVALTTAGTGYATSGTTWTNTAVTSCVAGSISGTAAAVSGALTTLTVTQDSNACTAVPPIVITGAGTGGAITAAATTGTGATLTAALFGASILSASQPLYILGAYNGTTASGSDTNASDPPLLIDTFAIGAGALSQTQIQSIFYQTKFYQGLLKTIPTTPYTLIFDNDGCGDTDNLYALATTIAAQKLGYIALAGVVNSDYGGGSQAMYRQMLDQAGLAHIPNSVPSAAGITNTTICTAANANTYNSATPQTHSAYESAATMYRTIFAANPTQPVFIMLGGSFRGVSDLMQSAADGISSLSGAQLVAQNAANGGAIYAQGLCVNCAFTGDNSLEDWVAGQYVVSHNGSLPIYWYMGNPQGSGPGMLATRNAKDPMFLMATTYGSDSRAAFDSLPTASFISSAFAAGVTIAIAGSGTGYANSTAFTSTGGGPNCVVTGTMVSASGVPTSIAYPNSLYPTYFGVGSGCTSAPTIVLTSPTGAGVVLTATALDVCGTVTITGASAGSTSTGTCSNHYFVDPSNATASGYSPILTWFLNSLINPPPNGAPRSQ